MSLINDIKRDREAGTPGPWMADGGDGEIFYNDGEIFPWVCCVNFDNTPNSQALSDCSRIARVPDMEAALLAAEELYRATNFLTDNDPDDVVCDGGGTAILVGLSGIRHALAAYRKATGDTQ